MIKYSLIIPCYNEEQNIDSLVSRCSKIFNKKNCEVILVDNGSIDLTMQKILFNIKKNNNLKLVKVKKNQGFGYGVFSGMKESSGIIIGYCHADLQTDPLDFLRAIDIIEKNKLTFENFLIKGRRKNRTLVDNFFTFFMSIYSSILFLRLLFDINAQPNVFNKGIIDNLKFIPKDFNIDLYLYYISKINNSKIFKFNVFFPDRKKGNGSNDQLFQKIKNSIIQIFNILYLRLKILF